MLIIVIPFALGCEPMNEGVRCRVWGQNMRRFRESTILEIEYLSHPVDLSQFPRLRKFVARETVVSCDDVLHSETTIVILNKQICETQTQGPETTTISRSLTTTFSEIAALTFNKPWIYATGIASGLLGVTTVVLCIVCVKRRCVKPPRSINIELDSVSSITEFDASVMRDIKID